MKRWTQDLVDLFNISPTPSSGSTRVEVIQFWGASLDPENPQSHAEVDIGLGDYTNKENLKNKINNLRFKRGRITIIPHGLDLLNREIPNNPNNPQRERYVLVLTDGVDDSTPENLKTITPPPGTLEDEANELRGKNNVMVFAIGFRGNQEMNNANLREIASSDDTFIHDDNLDIALNKTYNALIEKICPDSNIPTRPTALGEFNWCIVKCRKIMVSYRCLNYVW